MSYDKELLELKKCIFQKLEEFRTRDLEISKKEDKSLVTEFDLFISLKVKEIFSFRHPDFHFYSEEHPEKFAFPCVVLDPIDGTREFVKGYGECAVSLAILHSEDIFDMRNFGWIYNPFNGFEINNWLDVPVEKRKVSPPTTHVMVSRSEWEKSIHKKSFPNDIRITPIGSIAYKLGLLASGSCDVVVSTRDKNVWDIAAGILICHSRGLLSKSQGKMITKLHEEKFRAMFIWGREDDISIIEPYLTS